MNPPFNLLYGWAGNTLINVALGLGYSSAADNTNVFYSCFQPTEFVLNLHLMPGYYWQLKIHYTLYIYCSEYIQRNITL